jgi:hypothetical protein
MNEDIGVLLDDARHADPDPEDRRGVDSPLGEHRVQPGRDVPDDHVHLVLGGVERVLRLRALRHGQVEQLHPDPGLADIDADHVAAIRVDVEQHARPSAIGVLRAGLGDDAVLEQLTDDIGDRRGAQPSRGTEILAATGAAEI